LANTLTENGRLRSHVIVMSQLFLLSIVEFCP